jgi:hypothetical protein
MSDSTSHHWDKAGLRTTPLSGLRIRVSDSCLHLCGAPLSTFAVLLARPIATRTIRACVRDNEARYFGGSSGVQAKSRIQANIAIRQLAAGRVCAIPGIRIARLVLNRGRPIGVVARLLAPNPGGRQREEGEDSCRAHDCSFNYWDSFTVQLSDRFR